jgi:hypothetical protein
MIVFFVVGYDKTIVDCFFLLLSVSRFDSVYISRRVVDKWLWSSYC